MLNLHVEKCFAAAKKTYRLRFFSTLLQLTKKKIGGGRGGIYSPVQTPIVVFVLMFMCAAGHSNWLLSILVCESRDHSPRKQDIN